MNIILLIITIISLLCVIILEVELRGKKKEFDTLNILNQNRINTLELDKKVLKDSLKNSSELKEKHENLKNIYSDDNRILKSLDKQHKETIKEKEFLISKIKVLERDTSIFQKELADLIVKIKEEKFKLFIFKDKDGKNIEKGTLTLKIKNGKPLEGKVKVYNKGRKRDEPINIFIPFKIELKD